MQISAECIEPCLISESSEEAAKALKNFNRETVGRPRLEVDQPDIIKSILDIVQVASATDDRRRAEIV